MKYLLIILCSSYIHISSAQVFDTLIFTEEYFVHFDSDESIIDLEAKSNLDSIFLKSKIFDKIILEGHTDQVGSEEYNQKLSAKRVENVLNAIISYGIDADKVVSKSFGEMMPLSHGASESSNKLNRRVFIRLYKSEKRRILKGRVEDSSTGEGLTAKVKLTGKNFIDSTTTKLDGSYTISAPDKALYKLEIKADDHFFEQKFIKLSPLDSSIVNIKLAETKIGSIHTLPNFNFRGDQAVLLRKSVPTLELLHDLLSNTNICIEIKGHVNHPNVPAVSINTKYFKLSEDRAEMVFENMVKREIDPSRMLPNGYGNWEMLYPKAIHESKMSENRRVEIKVIDCESEELLKRIRK